MAWDRRSRSSASSSRGRGATAMNSFESTGSLQPWACSSLSSSEKFLSLYEKMQEDRERKNFESLVCSPCIEQQGIPQEEQQFPVLLPPPIMMIDNPGSKIVFPHITSRGSLVGKKVYCRTSIHSSITWRQKSSTQRMRTSMMILNFYQDRSSSGSSLLLGGKQQQTRSSPAVAPADSVTSQKKPDHSLDTEQCRGLFLSLAGAAGMRLICPPLQLPLLEILLFFRQQLSNNRADRSEGGQGLWRFPVNLALATLRPFCGSLAGRCLTALLCLAQMRIKKNNYVTTTEQQNLMRYMSVPADLYSVVIDKEYNDLDRKEFTTMCSTNHFQIDDPVVATTDTGGDVAAANRAGRNNNNHGITRLSNVVVGRKLEEECWSNNDIQIVEILISESEDESEDSLIEREDSLSHDNLPNFLAKDQNNIGSEPGRSEDSEFSLVDHEGEDLSLLKQKESEELSSESGLVVTPDNGLHVAVEEARKESFAQSDVTVSCPALQFPLEFINVVNAAADSAGTVSALEDSEGVVTEESMPWTDRICLAEEEQPESTSVSPTTSNPKTSIVELADDDEPEKESFDNLRGRFFEVEFDGDASDGISPERLSGQTQTEVFLPEGTSDGNEFEKTNVTVPAESLPLAFWETAENQTINVAQEVKSELCVVEEKSVDRTLDCSIEERRTGGSECVSPERLPDLIELLMEVNWIGARKEFAKAAATLPLEKPSPAVTDLAEDEAVKKVQEGKSTHSIEELSAVKACDQGLEEIQKVKSEHCREEKLEDKEDRIDGDDCDDWLDSLLEQVEAFISERADVLSEHEKAAVTEVVENQAVKDIQEVNFTHPVGGQSPENVLDQEREVCPIEEYRIDDRNCAPSERLQGYTEAFLSSRTSSENGLDEKESPTAGAVTESLQKEVVKEIQEVNTTHLIEENLANGVLSQELEVCPIEEHIVGDRDCEFLNGLQGECKSHALTDFFGDQPIKEIQEVKSSHVVTETSAEKVVNQELEVSSIEGHRIDDSDCELSKRLQVQVDDSLPERTIAENGPQKESSDNLRGRNLEVDFDEDANVPLQEESNCTRSSSSQESSTGQKHDLRPSSTAMADDDSKSEDTCSSNHSGVTYRDSCLEHPESELISWTGETSPELSTQTSLTSRLNAATEADNKALDPDSGAIAVVLDDELNRDEKDGHIETKAKVLDEIKSAEAEEIGVNGENNCFPEKCSESSLLVDSLSTESYDVPQGYPEHPFADHPTCIDLREHRHSHGDQIYLDMKELLPAPWGQLIFWHGRCKEGRPTLCVWLGKAVRQLPGHELKNFIEVTVSHLEYAELNFFKGNVKQMNILMDLEGLGLMRLPPMHILSAIGAVLNRDYAGRGGWLILVNAPLMLGFVISAIQGVILRPANNKGAVIDSSFKGFLEGKERIIMMGGKYRTSLQKHFDCSMLPVSLGGECPCGSDEEPCRLGIEFLKLPWDTNSQT